VRVRSRDNAKCTGRDRHPSINPQKTKLAAVFGRGTRALVPASCLSDGAADSQLGAELKTGLQFLARDYGCSARPPQPAVYRSSCARSVLFIGPYLLKEHLGGKSIRRKFDYR
jgi:hypothetical protein